MIRLVASLAAAAAAAGCVSARAVGASSETESPAWLAARITEAEASDRGYPQLADTPVRPEDARSAKDWDRKIAEIQAMRETILTDPMLDDPDAPPGEAIDAATFYRETRAAAQREIERQTSD